MVKFFKKGSDYMPKYVCDFDALKNTSKALRDKAVDLRSGLSSCEGNVDSRLANWSGSASEAVKENNESAYKVLNEDIDTIEVMADYLDEASAVIQAAEEDLASQKI